MHETAVREEAGVIGVGGDVKVHVDPFHSSVKVRLATPLLSPPTPMHDCGLEQETALKIALLSGVGIGRFVGVQVEPFHWSTNWLFDAPEPTAMQKDVLVQDKPNRMLGDDAPRAWATLHAVPFHCSMRADSVPAKSAAPTATQKFVVRQESAVRYAPSAPVTVGIGSEDHVAPFQISAIVSEPSCVWLPSPTAMQKTDVTHETPVSVLAELAVAGLAIVVQLEADTVAGTVSAACALPLDKASGRTPSAAAHTTVR
jgi:hypothetical protein